MTIEELGNLEPCEVEYVRAVCGGGKSTAMLKKIAGNRNTQFLYAVPTKELAYDIQSTWLSKAVGGQPSDIHVITSDGPCKVKYQVEEVANPWERRLVVMTHQALLMGDYLSEFSGWNIIFDEDPQLLVASTLSDAKSNFSRFQKLVVSTPSVKEFALQELSEESIKELGEIAWSNEYRNDLPKNMRDVCRKLADSYCYLLLAKSHGNGYMYYLIAFTYFRRIVEMASQVTILASRLSGYTRAYLQLTNISIRQSPIQPMHSDYPIAVQRNVSVKRLFNEGSISISRIEKYSLQEIVDTIFDNFGERYLIRSNKKHKEFVSSVGDVISWLPRKSNGLNKFREVRAVADIAAFNLGAHFYHAYQKTDCLLGLKPGSWEKFTADNACEDSCQAIFRIGIRKIDTGDSDGYFVVVPDIRTEQYLKEHYLPHANYSGYLIDDTDSQKAPGRPVSPRTLKKVEMVEDLVENFGYSQRQACREQQLDPKTYRKHRVKEAA